MIKKKNSVYIALSMVLLSVLTILLISKQAPNSDQQSVVEQYDTNKTIRYSYTLSNSSSKPIRNARFTTFAPVKKTATQRCCKKIQTNHPYQLEEDSIGNQMLSFDFDFIPPFGSKTIQINITMETAITPNKTTLIGKEEYLKEAKYVESSHPEIKQLAQQLWSPDDKTLSENIYHWVSQNLKYAGFVSADKGALYALQNKTGDCTEYMYLAMALARAQSIPARGIAGYVYANNAILKAEDNHNWSEFYFDGSWQLVDAQKNAFIDNQQSYIAMRNFSQNEDTQHSNSHRFWDSHKALKVRMN